MAGRSSATREALARQNAAIMAVFERAGFEHIAPDIIQPADIFLERSGEDIRARTFVFNDPDGNELCLRPDLTVPACRYYLHNENQGEERRYCYLGTAFRFPDEALSPQEFNQAGIEWFGGDEATTSEVRVMKLALSALEVAGLSGLKVTLGDIGLFNALIDDIDMPQRWRWRLRHHFWRPQAFHNLLDGFSKPRNLVRTSISANVDALDSSNPVEAVETRLKDMGLALVTDRTAEDIAARLSEKWKDRAATPLPAEAIEMIESYLKLSGPLTDMPEKLKRFADGKCFASVAASFEKRIEALEDQGLNPRRFHFSAEFGRELEYYTGLVFQVDVDARNQPVTVAGGGRYDEMLKDLGAVQSIPAVGCAIHTERVKAVMS
jgi:ATP phosphoribosyltransferase regulatory subunit